MTPPNLALPGSSRAEPCASPMPVRAGVSALPQGSVAAAAPVPSRARSATALAPPSPRRPVADSGHPRGARRVPASPVPSGRPAILGSIRPRLAFDHLGERSVTVEYEVHGDPGTGTPAARVGTLEKRPSAAVPTLVLGGISAGRRLGPAPFDPGRGWWPGLVGPGAALDPARRALIGVDYLGGTDRDASRPLRPVTTRDQARAVAAVLDHLGIARAAFVGASYGGMVALAFAELFPERTGRLVVLCAAHRTHPMATAVRSVQRAAVGLGVDSGDPARGLSLARALAMTTYRSTREFEERFSAHALSAGTPGGDPARFPVQDYIEARGADFVRSFDTERFLALSESIDLHRTRPGSLPEHALLVSFDTDVLVPPWLMDELAARGSGAEPRGHPARHVTIPSPYGHDAFLKEIEEVSERLRAEFRGNEVEAVGTVSRQPCHNHEEATR